MNDLETGKSTQSPEDESVGKNEFNASQFGKTGTIASTSGTGSAGGNGGSSPVVTGGGGATGGVVSGASREPERDPANRFGYLGGYHVVLGIGARNSGKTVMMGSLLDGLLQQRLSSQKHTITPILGRIPYPRHLNPDLRFDEAEKLYDQIREAFQRGGEIHRTQLTDQYAKTDPLFLPVVLTITDRDREDQKVIRFAFVEAMGEWYGNNEKRSPGKRSRNFPESVESLLEFYKQPISLIFVLPCGDSLTYVNDIERIQNCLEDYQTFLLDKKVGENRQADNLLLLLSKWDQEKNPDTMSSEFSAPTTATILEYVNKSAVASRFWKVFAPVPVKKGSKAILPHASAVFLPKGSSIEVADKDASPPIDTDNNDQKVIDKFNKTLWNWLADNHYKQAEFRAAKTESANQAVQPILFDDVAPETDKESKIDVVEIVVKKFLYKQK